ncbi:hypothetical protein [Pedobacter alpinus]|uniref:Outer membrane protein beta-barrel domain-containing protein n=1 Tax=Pedobacter alpinus TaxID=1590643 RepID=A0ABW5TP13_9SPHI
MKKLYFLLLLIGCLLKGTATFSQNNNLQNNSHFFLGVDFRIATLVSGTSIKTIMSLKLGYNQKIANEVFAGPQINALFIKSPINRGARISLFAGPSVEYEHKQTVSINKINNSTFLSSRASWVFPVNPKTSDYTYMDCISVGISYNSDDIFGFNKTGLDLNLDLQRYDIGFYSKGFSRMVNVSSGSHTTF